MVRLLVFVLSVSFATASHAVPLRLNYDVELLDNGLFEYDFEVRTTIEDGDFLPGMSFNWFVLGVGVLGAASVFAEGADFFRDTPDGTRAGVSSGFVNGPELCFNGSCITPGWTPTSVGESFSFRGVSETLVDHSEFDWTFLHMTSPLDGQTVQQLQIINPDNNTQPSPIPLPAPILLLGAGIAGLAAAARRRKPGA
ncbi:MAG: VPLPA-CTERM sorting domain-containing protein [Pseudomonadota bacterium]